MIEKTARLRVKCGDGIHIPGAEFKIEDIEIFGNPFLLHRFGDGNDTPLGQPAQNDLGYGPAALCCDGKQQFIFKNVIFTLRKRSPGFNLDIVLLQELLGFDLLAERMGFNLID